MAQVSRTGAAAAPSAAATSRATDDAQASVSSTMRSRTPAGRSARWCQSSVAGRLSQPNARTSSPSCPDAHQAAPVGAGRGDRRPPLEVAGRRVDERPPQVPGPREAGLHRAQVGHPLERAALRQVRVAARRSTSAGRVWPRAVRRAGRTRRYAGPDADRRPHGAPGRERPRDRLRRARGRPAPPPAPQRELVGPRGLRRAAAAAPPELHLLPARRARPRDDPLGRRGRLPLRLAGRRPRGVRRRARPRGLPPARVLDGGGDRAPVRRAPAGAAAVARRRRDLAAPRAPDVGRAPDDGPGVHQAGPALGGRPLAPARSRPGRGRVGAPDAGHRPRRRGAAAPRARGPIRIDAPALVVVGDRDPFVPVDQAWALKRQLPDARLFVAPDCGHEVPARRTALFNEAVAGFYRSTEAAAASRAGP